MFGHKINSITEKLLFRIIKILRYLIKMGLKNENCDCEIEEHDSQQELCVSQTSCKHCKIVCKTSSECDNCRTMTIKCKLSPSGSDRLQNPFDANADFDIFNLRKLYQMSGHSLRPVRSLCRPSISNAIIRTSLNSNKLGGSPHSVKVQFTTLPPVQEEHGEDRGSIEIEVDKTPVNESNNTSHSSHILKYKILSLPLTEENKCNRGNDTTKDISNDDIIIISSDDDDDEKSNPTGISEVEDEENDTTHSKSSDFSNNVKTPQAKTTQTILLPGNYSEKPTQTQLCVEMHPPRLFKIPSSSSSSDHNVSGSQPPPIRSTIPNSHKQRQLELHRLRIQVERKRLELLELKLKRERDEMKREQIAVERSLVSKHSIFHDLNDEKEV
ncbi:uncharacterized protein [Musca autumnalis]|uniref:uncharacterized protein n=1 Tax=Musca autumnalis TaxID=221902 RepID=UPI003CFA7173